jgi:hypothetical protein
MFDSIVFLTHHIRIHLIRRRNINLFPYKARKKEGNVISYKFSSYYNVSLLYPVGLVNLLFCGMESYSWPFPANEFLGVCTASDRVAEPK